MFGKLILQWKAVVFPLLAFVVIYCMRYLEKRMAARKVLTDAEYLCSMARYRETSEYELFKVAAREWRLPVGRIESDFKRYLLTEIMPYYVKDFVRKARARRHQAAVTPA